MKKAAIFLLVFSGSAAILLIGMGIGYSLVDEPVKSRPQPLPSATIHLSADELRAVVAMREGDWAKGEANGVEWFVCPGAKEEE